MSDTKEDLNIETFQSMDTEPVAGEENKPLELVSAQETGIANAHGTSLRKIEANRRNGAKGGVKTAAGKLRTRRNAMKHGMRAAILLVDDNGGAACEEFRQMRNALEDEHRPRTATEYIVMEQMAMAAQRLRNGFRFERAELGDTAAFQLPVVDRLGRYQTAASRLFFKSRAELAKLLAEETEAPEEN